MTAPATGSFRLTAPRPRSSTGQPHRLAGLDAVRGIAIIMVLGAHFGLGPLPIAAPAWLDGTLRQWQTSGWSGVDLFFVLSGFLISGLLFREYLAGGGIRIGRFLIRRGLKIYPAYYVMVFFTVLAMLASGNQVSGAAVVSEVFFVQNYGPRLYNYTWSLAVEEHFYLLLAMLVAWLVSRDGHVRRILRIVVWALPIILLARYLSLWGWPTGYQDHVSYTHLRLDGLAFGVALGYLAVFHGPALEAWVRRWRWVLLGGTALLSAALLGVPHTNPRLYTAGLTALYLGAGSLLLLARYTPFGPLPRRLLGPLAWVGANSYAIYLWHVPVREWGGGLLALLTGQTVPTVVGLALYVVAAIVFGAFMTRVIERPALAWRDRRFP